MSILETISEIKSLRSDATKGRVELEYPLMTTDSMPGSYDVVLSSEKINYTVTLGAPSSAPRTSVGQKRGTICSYPRGQHHYETDDKDGRDFPGRVRTSRSWTTMNRTAETDAKMHVLIHNNLDEILRLAEIGAKTEKALRVE